MNFLMALPISVACGFTVIGVVSALESKEDRAARIDREERHIYATSRATEALRQELRDIDSTKFNLVRVYQKGFVVCGLLNTKNGFGGYTGWQQFIWAEKKVVTHWYHPLLKEWEVKTWPVVMSGAFMSHYDQEVRQIFTRAWASHCHD